jgi:hypothetical protein
MTKPPLPLTHAPNPGYNYGKPLEKAGTMQTRFFLSFVAATALSLLVGLAYGEGGEDMVVDPEMGISFRTPEGWTARKQPEGYMFSSDSLEGLIVIIPHDFEELGEMAEAAREGIEDEESGTNLQLSSLIKHYGNNGISGEFKGVFQNRAAKAYGIGLLSPRGEGVIVLAAVEPESYSNAYPKLVQTIASSIVFVQKESGEPLP